MELMKQLSEFLQKGDDKKVAELTRKALDENVSPRLILDEGLIEGMNAVGEQFRVHEIFLPDVLLAARAMNAGMDILKPFLIGEKIESRGKIVIGTVQGDLHDIGKNLVSIMLKGAGFEVVDLGKDVSPEKFVETARSESADVIGLSALLTTTMPVMKEVVDLLREEEPSGKIKVIIGGAPVTQEFAEEIGADSFAFDGAAAVERVKNLFKKA